MDSTAPLLNQKPNALLNQEIAAGIIQYRQNKNEPMIILIDGKAAAGKSTMAEALAKLLVQRNQPVCIIEADWFLKDRIFRTAELEEIIQSSTVHTDSHIRFWNWDEFQIQLQKVRNQAQTGGQVTLTHLYDRGTGECDGSIDIEVAPNSIILVPGCYLLTQPIDYDLAFMLYVNKETGRQRKLNREYLKSKEGFFPSIKAMGTMMITWEMLEDPTFLYHMVKNGNKANIIIDTSGPGFMSIIKFEIDKYQAKGLVEFENIQYLINYVASLSAVGREIGALIQSGKSGKIPLKEVAPEFMMLVN